MKLVHLSGGFSSFATNDDDGKDNESEIVISGHINFKGLYKRSKKDINDRPHFQLSSSNHSSTIHLYWSKNQWILHYDTDPSLSYNNLIAYSKSTSVDPRHITSQWYVRSGDAFSLCESFKISNLGELSSSKPRVSATPQTVEVFGVPKALWPIFLAFMFDAIAVGLAMPLLPFYVMQLKANAVQLSMVVSANYVAQMLGCIVMGRVSDRYGRRVVALCCLTASSLSYFCVSRSTTLISVALARVISGSCGGLVPVVQAAVADVIPLEERPKYLGRIQAAFGMGFVIGPMISALLPQLSIRQKIRLAALLPLSGLLTCAMFFQETKHHLRRASITATAATVALAAGSDEQPSGLLSGRQTAREVEVVAVEKQTPVSGPVRALVHNGFLLMYAFATETLYAMVIQDVFGYGERVLSTVFAVNGLLIGLFQVFLIRHVVQRFGKHGTLAIGNAMLAVGMLGIALCRQQSLHFLAFTIHIVGYSIADTGVASLISRYASQMSQGRDLALNQAAQACARVVSPVIAGVLYERSMADGRIFGKGALPFLVGAMFPAIGVAIPALLKMYNARNSAVETETDGGDAVH